MKYLTLFVLIFFAVNLQAQRVSLDITKVNDSTYIVKETILAEEAADTLFDLNQTWRKSYAVVNSYAVEAALAMSRYFTAIRKYNDERSNHDAVFVDSTYIVANRSLVGPDLEGDWILKEQGQADINMTCDIQPNGTVRLFETATPANFGNFAIDDLRSFRLNNYFTGDNVDFYFMHGNRWRGERDSNGNRVFLEKQ